MIAQAIKCRRMKLNKEKDRYEVFFIEEAR